MSKKYKRIQADEYGDFYIANAIQAYNKLKQPSGCRLDKGVLETMHAKWDFEKLIKSTHPVRIPVNVLHMKLLKFVNNIKKRLWDKHQPTLGNAVLHIKYIGFSGMMRAGKTLSSNFLAEEFRKRTLVNPKVISFSDTMKTMMLNYFGFTYDDLYTQEGKTRYNEFWGMTNRVCLQKFGTEAFRNGFHKDTWVKLAELQTQPDGYIYIFDDVRFDNEIEFIKKNGIVIYVDRQHDETSTPISKHASEQISRQEDHILLNDGTVDDLRDNIVKLFTELKIL